jgi:hypothetical protein
VSAEHNKIARKLKYRNQSQGKLNHAQVNVSLLVLEVEKVLLVKALLMS